MTAVCFVSHTVFETLFDQADANIAEVLKHKEIYVAKSMRTLSEPEHQPEDYKEVNTEEPEAAPSSLKQPVFRFLSMLCKTQIEALCNHRKAADYKV